MVLNINSWIINFHKSDTNSKRRESVLNVGRKTIMSITARGTIMFDHLTERGIRWIRSLSWIIFANHSALGPLEFRPIRLV